MRRTAVTLTPDEAELAGSVLELAIRFDGCADEDVPDVQELIRKLTGRRPALAIAEKEVGLE